MHIWKTSIRITLILYTYCILVLFVVCMYNISDTLEMQHECCRGKNVWNVLNCTLKSEHPPAPSVTWVRSERAENCATPAAAALGNRCPAAPRLTDPNYCCWHEPRHLTPKADGWVAASGEWCRRFCSFVRSELPPPVREGMCRKAPQQCLVLI